MKFKTCIENAREELVKSFEFIKGVNPENQSQAITRANNILGYVDSLIDFLDNPKKSKKPKIKPRNLYDDDPSAQQMREIWTHMNAPDATEYKLMVLRLEPQVLKTTKISGYLQTFHLPTTIPDIIEQVGEIYGGGKYQIRIVDGAGKYVKSKVFEISGLPKIPSLNQVMKQTIEEAANDPVAKKASQDAMNKVMEDIDKNNGRYRS
jgi:hypothetical protein